VDSGGAPLELIALAHSGKSDGLSSEIRGPARNRDIANISKVVNGPTLALVSRGMATVAEQLRQGREARGLTVPQVADATKMRTDHVRALEAGDYNVFVAPVYIRGFVRTYARLLKLDDADLMRTLETELAQTEKFSEPPSLLKVEHTPLDAIMLRLSHIDWRIAMPVAGLLLILILGLWGQRAVHRRQAQNPLAGITPGLYEPARQPAGDTLPLPTPAGARR